jgi:muramoyltetrapeptide carboxypeptidase LdcA involved in peptidoglycan recycling
VALFPTPLIKPRHLQPGHASPILTLPYGVRASIDCAAASLTIHEAGVT